MHMHIHASLYVPIYRVCVNNIEESYHGYL